MSPEPPGPGGLPAGSKYRYGGSESHAVEPPIFIFSHGYIDCEKTIGITVASNRAIEA